MGAGVFHGRVRDGIGCGHPAIATRSSKPSWDLFRMDEVLVLCCVLRVGGPCLWWFSSCDG